MTQTLDRNQGALCDRCPLRIWVGIGETNIALRISQIGDAYTAAAILADEGGGLRLGHPGDVGDLGLTMGAEDLGLAAIDTETVAIDRAGAREFEIADVHRGGSNARTDPPVCASRQPLDSAITPPETRSFALTDEERHDAGRP
ncbi:MAG TPA: hypothetical protein ENJ18_00945 [Nannocystis exedens]|nr:hypothetical protein [Nannocystis exedens]